MNKKTLVFLSVSLSALTLSVLAIVLLRGRTNSSSVVYHTVTFDSNGGSQIDSISVKHGEMISRPSDPLFNGFKVKAWIHDDEEWLFNVYYVTKDLTLKAEWELDEYSISYNLNGGHFDEEYATSYTYESSFDLPIPSKSNFAFGGWFTDSGKGISEIVPGMYGNLNLSARWYNNLLVESLDSTRGYVVVQGDDTDSDKISLLSKPMANKYHVFIGWFDEFGNFLSNDNPFTTTLKPNIENKFFAKYMDDEQEEAWNDLHGVNFVIHTDQISGKEYVTYGMYPQSVVNDNELIDILENSNSTELGNYYYDGNYYVNQKAKLHDEDLINRFDNGETIEDGKTYWFKIEPIRWTIFKDTTNSLELFSEKLIDSCTYQTNYNSFERDEETIEPNNYRYSVVREFLNNDFFNKTFIFDNTLIKETEIDNSASTTAAINNPYCCENTFDKVYLPSFKDYLSISSSSSSTPLRCFKTTDFSRIKNAKIGFDSNNEFCGYCWTRSPYWEVGIDRGYYISKVNMNGTINKDGVTNNSFCIQPCVTVSKDLL